MPAPELTPAAERLFEQVEPLAYADAEHGHALAHLCAAAARMIDRAYGLAHDADVPWGIALDGERAADSDLDWLGQLAGVRLPGYLTPAARRTRVLETDGRRRGTVGAIVGAARQHLTGTRRVELRERDGSPYKLRVITFTAETPDPAKVQAALLEQKPAGLVLTYEVRDGQSYGQAEDRNATYGAARLAYPTYGAARASIPS
jgi:hypothetical protein